MHDVRFAPENISASDSSYTEAGPRAAGVGDPSDASSAGVVEATGDQDVAIKVQCLQSGLPRLTRGARVGYRLSSETGIKLRGWQPPNVITGCWSQIAATDFDNLSALTLRNGDVLSAYHNTSTDALTLRVWDAATATTSTVSSPPVSTVTGSGIGLALDDTGRVLFLSESTNGWTLWRSALDDLETWTEIARHMFDIVPDAGTDKLRLMVLPTGDMAVVAFRFSGVSDTIEQWASPDQGATFTQVDTVANVTTAISDALLTPAGRIGIVRVTSGNVCNWHSSASAWTGAMDSTAVQIATSVAEAWCAADPVGRIYVWTRSSASADRILVHYSEDEGASWTTMDFGLTDQGGDVAQYLTGGQAVHTLGAFMLVHQAVDNVDTVDPSPRYTRCGGWSNVVLQSDVAGGSSGLFADSELLGSGYTGGSSFTGGCIWLPLSEPDDLTCWTAAGTGGDGADVLGTNGIAITTNGDTRYYDSTTAPAAATTAHVIEWALTVSAAGSLTQRDICVQSILSDGANASELSVVHATTGFAIMDAAGVLDTVLVSLTTEMMFRIIHYKAGAGEVYYRRPYESAWTRAYSDSTLSTTAVATGRMRWGHPTAPAGATTSLWRYLWHKTGTPSTSLALIGSPATAISGWNWMMGRQITGLPAPLDNLAASTAGEGSQVTLIRGTDGPLRATDVWTLTPNYDHPVQALLPTVQPSPRRTWRSTGTGSTTTIGFTLDGAIATSLSRNIGVAVFGANVRYVALTAGENGGAHTTLGTMDLATGMTSLSYTRASGSNVVRITGTSDATRYIWRDELVGATVKLDGTYYRKVLRHTEGIWSDVSGKHVEIVLDGVTDAEPTSGTLDIWSRNGVLVIHGISALYDEYALSIASGTNADGYQEIGTVIIGPLVAAGQSHGWGDVSTYEPNVSSSTSRDGVTRARRLGPPIRSWTWAWPDGIDLSRLRDASPTPDYLAHTATSEGIANVNDVPYLLAGMLEEVRSGEIPMVALAYIPATSGTTITDPSLFLGPARIESSIGIEHIQGDPETDPVYRISPITMRQIP